MQIIVEIYLMQMGTLFMPTVGIISFVYMGVLLFKTTAHVIYMDGNTRFGNAHDSLIHCGCTQSAQTEQSSGIDTDEQPVYQLTRMNNLCTKWEHSQTAHADRYFIQCLNDILDPLTVHTHTLCQLLHG